jgi:hypothetical protein
MEFNILLLKTINLKYEASFFRYLPSDECQTYHFLGDLEEIHSNEKSCVFYISSLLLFVQFELASS